MTDHQAYDEGYDAYWDGIDVSDIPDVKGSLPHAS